MRTVTLLAGWLAVAATVLAAPLGAASRFPERIALPEGFQPEGIAIGKRGTFYVGSIPTGAIYRGSLRTGDGAILNPGGSGRAAIGVELCRGRLYVAGGPTGKGFVYSAKTGRLLATHQLTTETDTFVNDVVVARGVAYFTDSRQKVVYRLGSPKKGHGSHNGVRTIPLTGDIQYVAGFNANGIDTTANEKTLVIVQSNRGKLFRVDPRSGRTIEIALDEPVTNGDGLHLDGRTLYVVQNRDNKVAVVRLARRLASGEVVQHITDPDFDVPTTIDEFGHRLYAVSARFRPSPPPDLDYWLAQFRKVRGR
jgi:sugar lactone lactonase YvrE